MKAVIGIDEVGRGPLAGPLCVCALRLTQKSQFGSAAVVRDSKKLTESKRLALFSILEREVKEGAVSYALSYVSASDIDAHGMSRALLLATEKALTKLGTKSTDRILLDGSLRAPSSYTNQETIIRGDESQIAIALASVVAKVSRDRLMNRYAKKWPEYGFEKNKGYGTHGHCEAIRRHGACSIHRRSFLSNILRLKNV